MSLDAQQPQRPSLATAPQRPLLAVLTRWWSPAAAHLDTDLGYESALPWTVAAHGPAERAERPY